MAQTSAERQAAAAALDLHEGISDPVAGGCQRWPEALRLLNHSTGELVPGRCKSTNLCDYCAKLAAVENAECLWLDALEGNAPTLWLVLTTRTADPNPARFYRSREQVLKALRRRFPGCEVASLVEFTTGYGPRAGGLRRPHWNVWIKGVAGHEEEAAAIAHRVWCDREDAEPAAQSWRVVHDVAGLARYCALHFQKESQAPPRGWRGHRFVKSRGYFSRPMPQVREEARRSLRLKRLLWRGLSVDQAELELLAAASVEWSLHHVKPSTVELPEPERVVVDQAAELDELSQLRVELQELYLAEFVGGGERDMSKRHRVPGMRPQPSQRARVYTQVLVCDGCGEHSMHVEVVLPGDEPPNGPPLEMLICDECDGIRYPQAPPLRSR